VRRLDAPLRTSEGSMKNGTADKVLDHFLHESLRQRRTVDVFLREGLRVTGRITAHDRYSILLERQGVECLIYKSAITRVSRLKRSRLF
jgi:RNA chaperone Hfq